MLGVNHVEDPFAMTPDQQEQRSFQPGDVSQEPNRSTLSPGNSGEQVRISALNHVDDPLIDTSEPQAEQSANPDDTRRSPKSEVPHSGGKTELPFVLGLDLLRHPFSDTPIFPDVGHRVGSTSSPTSPIS